MNTSARLANTPVSTVQLVTSPATAAPERPTPAAQAAPAPLRPQPAPEPEADDQTKRDFYAWCSGCEGFGSIF